MDPDKKEFPNLGEYASADFDNVIRDIEQSGSVASDLNRSLSERLYAYEDIIASEIGDTAFVRARNMEREYSFRQIYLKFEGGNPSGTQKDRIAFAQVQDALRRGYGTLCFATCGNYGASMAFAASLAGLKCRIYIPLPYSSKRLDEISRFGAEIVRKGDNYEESVTESSKDALENDFYDANPGGRNTALQLRAYGEIAREIFDELRDAPYAVAVPVSNGTTLAGIYRGFVTLYRRGKTSRIPRIIAGSSSGKNPIVTSFRNHREDCEDLVPEKIKESPINEPLINWHSIDGQDALKAIYESGGWAFDASDKKMNEAARLVRKKEGLSVLPASTAGLIALLQYAEKEHLPGDRYVAVLTGRQI